MFDPNKEFLTLLPARPISYSELNNLICDIAYKCYPTDFSAEPVRLMWKQATELGWVKFISGGYFEVQDPRTPEATP